MARAHPTRFTYRLGDQFVAMSVQGPVERGGDVVLLDHDDDLTAEAPWADAGYVVASLLTPERHERLVAGIEALVNDVVRSVAGDRAGRFPLDQYHRHVDDEVHEAVVDRIQRGFPLAELPVDPRPVVARTSELCGVELTTSWPAVGAAVNPELTGDRFAVRIVRPHVSDHNPPHRDVWLDRLRNGINLYIPVCGSDIRSSLGLVPGSHRWPESRFERTRSGASIDGRRFTVPSVTGPADALRLVRPDPEPGEVLVFSPYLIHGGARNLNRETTRISVEIRCWRALA